MSFYSKEQKREYDRQWYIKNKEKRKISNKAYYEKTKVNRLQNQKEYRYKNAYKYYKLNAKRRKIDFDITQDEFNEIIKKPCHYCGSTDYIGIDRIEYKKGYTKNNILPCCGMCNRMKNIYSYEDFINKCKQITNNFS